MVVPGLPRAGMEMVVATLTRGLSRRGHDVGVTCIEFKGSLGRALEEEGFRVSCVPAPGIRAIMFPLRLTRWFMRKRPDVVHIHTGAWLKGARAAGMARVPRVVFTMHGLDGTRPPYEPFLDRMAGRYTTDAVAVSDAFVPYLTEKAHIPRARVRVIPNGVDTNLFRPGPRTGRVREPCGIEDDAIVIGHVARFSPVKNHAMLIDAFAQVVHVRPRTFLVLVGDGPLRARVEEQVNALGLASHVRFLGLVADLHDVYRDFDILVLPSTTEAAPMSLLEAMSTGLPIVATAVGGIPALLARGDAGLLVPPADATALAGALVHCASDAMMRVQMGLVARSRAEACYSEARMLDVYEALYFGHDLRGASAHEDH